MQKLCNNRSVLAKKPVIGLIMAGGLSSRLGYDKASISLDSRQYSDLLGRTAAILKEVIGEVYIVGREYTGYPNYLDDVPGLGPVGGIATGLRHSGAACFVLSCDLPFMTKEIVEKLLYFRNLQPENILMTAYKQQETGFSEPLVAIYEHAALPYFQTCVERRLLKINRIVPIEQQAHLAYQSHESLPFFNINYPADLEVAKRILSVVDGS